MVKNLPTSAGDSGIMGSIPGSRSFPGVENGNALQYSCLENAMDKEVWKMPWTKKSGSLQSMRLQAHKQ